MKKTILNLLTALLLVGTSLSLHAQFDRVLHFDGVNDYILMPNNAELQIADGTVEAWIKADLQSDYHGIVVKQFSYGLFIKDGYLMTYDWRIMQDVTSGTFVATDTWHHVAITFQSGVANGTKFYVDGILKATVTYTVDATGVGHELVIGRGATYSNQQLYHGLLDEVRIWNVVRTQSEIQTAMNAPLMGNETGLVAYYNFNNGTANGNNSGVTNLADVTSGVTTNGTLNSFSLAGNMSNWVIASSPLPVDLLSFKATPQYETVKLEWKATNNSLNKGFQIERLKVQNNEWEVLDFVAADAKNNAYEYLDNSYVADRNVNYYRLRQIDLDGTETFSKVVSVSFNKGKSLKIYPSIVSEGLLNLEMTGKGADTEGSSFAIVNMFGQQMQSGKMTGQAVNVSALPNGTYIVKVGMEQARFVKQ